MWDGHFDEEDLPEKLKRNDLLLSAVGMLDECLNVEQRTTEGVTFAELVKEALTDSEKDNVEILEKEKKFYIEALGKAFYETVVS